MKAKLKKVIVLLATLVMCFSMFGTVAYAADDAEAGNTEYITDGKLKGLLNTMLNDIAGNGGFGENVEYDAILSTETDENGNYKSALRSVWETNKPALQNIYDAFYVLGMLLSTIYCIIYITREMIERRENSDSIIKGFIILMVVSVILGEGFTIMDKLMDLGTGIGQTILDIQGTDPATPTMNQSFIDKMNASPGLISQLGGVIELFIPWIGTKILYVYIEAVIFMRMIAIYARVCLAPIRLGDLYSGGPSPEAIRFLRGFLAVCLQGAVIVIALYAYRLMWSGIGSSLDHYGVWANFVVLFAVGGFIGKSESFAKELCGAG